jgi:hypothetical protein
MNFLIVGENKTIKESIIAASCRWGGYFPTAKLTKTPNATCSNADGLIFIDFDVDEDLETLISSTRFWRSSRADPHPGVVSSRTSRSWSRT